MIDKLSLTTYRPPDREYLENHGTITEDTSRSHIYKFICRLDRAVVFYYPHKFGESRNANIPFTKIDINPKYFSCSDFMLSYIFCIFNSSSLNIQELNTSRLDIAVDIEDFPIDALLSMLRVKNIRSTSLSFYRGTIYAGSDPKIRIYDKTQEIKSRLKKGFQITDYEKELLGTGKSHTRFEIQIRSVKKNLQEILTNPESFASHYDRLQFFDFQTNGDSGVLQVLYKYINRKFRAELEKYCDNALVEKIKDKYIAGVQNWLNEAVEPF